MFIKKGSHVDAVIWKLISPPVLMSILAGMSIIEAVLLLL